MSKRGIVRHPMAGVRQTHLKEKEEKKKAKAKSHIVPRGNVGNLPNCWFRQITLPPVMQSQVVHNSPESIGIAVSHDKQDVLQFAFATYF